MRVSNIAHPARHAKEMEEQLCDIIDETKHLTSG